jgi:hypothetical protein
MSKAAELAALIGSQTAQGNKNFIINGAMQVAQRATSVSSVTSGGYNSLDRHNFNISSAGTWTISQSTTAPTGFSTSMKFDCTTADGSLSASDYLIFEHRIEAQNLQQLSYGTSSAKNLTLSFYVRSNKTGTYVAEFQHGDAGSNYWNNNTYTIDSADTWEKKTITFSGQTAAAINNDNGIGLYIRLWLATGTDYSSGSITNDTWHQTSTNRAAGQVNLADSTDNEWYITGIQLEIGEVATPFEHEDFGTTLRRCKRYFQKVPGKLFGGYGAGADYLQWYFDGEMRTAPTVTGTTGTVDIDEGDFTTAHQIYNPSSSSYAVYAETSTADAEL